MLSWFTPFEGWFADAIELTLDDRRYPTRARWPSGATRAPRISSCWGRSAEPGRRGSDPGLRSLPPRYYQLSYRAQPLTLTRGVAPRCPSFTSPGCPPPRAAPVYYLDGIRPGVRRQQACRAGGHRQITVCQQRPGESLSPAAMHQRSHDRRGSPLPGPARFATTACRYRARPASAVTARRP